MVRAAFWPGLSGKGRFRFSSRPLLFLLARARTRHFLFCSCVRNDFARWSVPLVSMPDVFSSATCLATQQLGSWGVTYWLYAMAGRRLRRRFPRTHDTATRDHVGAENRDRQRGVVLGWRRRGQPPEKRLHRRSRSIWAVFFVFASGVRRAYLVWLALFFCCTRTALVRSSHRCERRVPLRFLTRRFPRPAVESRHLDSRHPFAMVVDESAWLALAAFLARGNRHAANPTLASD